MLISLSNRFIHIANLKVASTAIEDKLRPYAEVALVESRFGKHQSVQQFQDRFGWIFAEVPAAEFFIFGVIREPASYVLSLFNSHSAPKFRSRPELYTGDMSFDEFLGQWVPANGDMIRPQCERFLGHHRLIGTNFVVSYENLHSCLPFLAERTGVSDLTNIASENVSPQRLKFEDLTKGQLDWISEKFRLDLSFRSRYCDRLLPSFHFALEAE